MARKMMKMISPSFPGNSALFSFFDFQLCTIFFIARYSSFAAVNDKHVKEGLSKPTPTHLEKLVIDKCKSRSLKLDEALGFFNFMISQRPLPSIWAFNHLLGALAKMKHYSTVVSMCKQMMGCEGMHPDIATMNIFMNCFCNLKQADFCFSVLALILKLGLQPNSYSMNYLLLGRINEGKIDEAMKLFWQIVQTGYPYNVYTCNVIIGGLCKSGYTRYAVKILKKMNGSRSLEPNVVTYSVIIDGFCKEGSVDKSLIIFQDMLDRGVEPNIVTYTTLIQGLCGNGQWNEAKGLIADMINRGISPNVYTFNTLIDSLCKEGKTGKAFELLQLMTQKGLKPDVFTYSSIIRGFCQSSQWKEGKTKDEVSRYIEEMIQKGMIPDSVSVKMLKRI
ncbi:hypothetical protein COLO4_20322 [Corchorus olitorius]|uniref:Pentacotripeptide-repeat region of PRORP domain-containing protein n=1 Tax=Corchorus olitorius TaxID=93759 RepID=A0A1R3J0E1_9ROSI|nr:hypothetical protein COLO4_20322 [Corchorus olitorius]